MPRLYTVQVKLEGVLEVIAESEENAVARLRLLPIEQIAEESDTEVEYTVLGQRDT